MASRRVVCGGSTSMVSFGNVNGRKRSMVSFEDVYGGKRSEGSFFHFFDKEESIDEELDAYFHQAGKKKRLTPAQIQFLERNFEVENKLEPDRKYQLAKDIGLEPRQVAIWFQNRRARFKTNHLEKDYKALQASYNSLKADYDMILKEKEKLEAQVLHITENLLFPDSQQPPEKPIVGSVSDDEVSKVSVVACGDVLDSVSPHYTDAFCSSRLEPGDSSYVFEQADLSHDEEENFSRSLESPPAYLFPNIQDADYPDPPANSCYFGFPSEDHSFGFWSN